MTLSPWLLILFAVPALLLGDQLSRRVGILARFHIPSPVVGGLLISLVVLLINLAGPTLQFATKVTPHWWTWLVTIEPEWVDAPARGVHVPFLIAFFTC